MKTFTKMPNVLLWLWRKIRTMTKNKETLASIMASHPSLYISMWVSRDFQKMPVAEFLQKYIGVMEDETISASRKEDVSAIVKPLYRKVTGMDYDNNYFKAFGLLNSDHHD